MTTLAKIRTESEGYAAYVTHWAGGADYADWVTVDVHPDRHDDPREEYRLHVTDLSDHLPGDAVRYALNVTANPPEGSYPVDITLFTSDPYTLARQLREAADALDAL